MNLDAELIELFHGEAASCTRVLADGLLELEAKGSVDMEALMRAAHSLKGASRIVGLDAAVELCHAMEDSLAASIAGKRTLGSSDVDALMAAADWLVALTAAPANDLFAWASAHEDDARALARDVREPRAKIAPPKTAERPAVSAPAARAAKPASVAEPPAPSAPAHEPPERTLDSRDTGILRVSAKGIERLIGLSGESRVEADRLIDSLGALRQARSRYQDVAQALEALERTLGGSGDALAGAVASHARSRLREALELSAGGVEAVEERARHLEVLSEHTHREALRSRMRPFGEGVIHFPRMVRDLGRALGKPVVLEMTGLATEVDRDVLEQLESSMNHLLRNAVDHGIESPEERGRAKKPERATIRLEASHEGGRLAVRVADDGPGVRVDGLRDRVVERGLATPEVAAALSDAELVEFLFLPGFSTKSSVTETSGRGVGLDVVRSRVRALGGTVKVTTEEGAGTTFHLLLPVTRAVSRSLIVSVSGERYAFPLDRIERVVCIPPSDISTVEGRPYATIDGDRIGLVTAQRLLDLPGDIDTASGVSVVVVTDEASRFGIAVDEVSGETDLLIRPLDERLGRVEDVAATSILADGSPVLVLSVDDLVQTIGRVVRGHDALGVVRGSTAEPQSTKRVLVVDDSITVREVERQLLVSHGYQVDVAVDGMDGWNRVRSGSYDIVVTDIDMPRMDGIELVRLIKADAKTRAIPVVIVSYKDRDEDRLRGLEAGADYYLPKGSFDDRILVDAVEDLIGGARP